jgi:hypothetical protein
MVPPTTLDARTADADCTLKNRRPMIFRMLAAGGCAAHSQATSVCQFFEKLPHLTELQKGMVCPGTGMARPEPD